MVARQIRFLSGALLYYGLVLPLSYLPLRVLYVFADFLYILLCTFLPYRKKVIEENIAKTFPSYTAREKIILKRNFYRFFADLVVESIKNISISSSELHKRFYLENPEILAQITALNKPVLLVAGHYNNWEWLITSQALWFKENNFGIGMPLSHPFWNRKLTERRERFGLKVVHASNYQTAFEKINPIVLVLADQAPSSADNCLWLPFLGRESGVIFGPEYMANLNDCAVVFASISNTKRGYYNIQLDVLVEDAKKLKYQDLTQLHLQKLEAQIQQNPARWLWSHKRWKHQKPANWNQSSQLLQQKFESKFRKHA
jgi:KDO2-lipid IV(A) lauroyltransferase